MALALVLSELGVFMKTVLKSNLYKSTLILLLALSVSVGCSKKQTKGSGADTTIPTDTQVVTGTLPTYSGGTAPVDSFSLSTLEAYAGRRINNPQNLRVTLDVFNVADPGKTKQYGDTGVGFKIAYEETCTGHTGGCNGSVRTVEGRFTAGSSIEDTKYNKLYRTGGADKYKFFFQDNLGGIIVSIEAINVNDIETKYKGRVYYRNFDFGVCSNPGYDQLPPVCNVQSPSKCWNISAGPYDCRAYMNGGKVRPDIVDLPGFGSTPDGYKGPGYQQLFTFTAMDIDAALNTGL